MYVKFCDCWSINFSDFLWLMNNEFHVSNVIILFFLTYGVARWDSCSQWYSLFLIFFVNNVRFYDLSDIEFYRFFYVCCTTNFMYRIMYYLSFLEGWLGKVVFYGFYEMEFKGSLWLLHDKLHASRNVFCIYFFS